MRIISLLQEVKVLGNETVDDQKPLMNNDTIRLYHGFSSPELLAEILTRGISGDRRIYRQYSYENNNNPKGLFSTPSIKTAKNFGDYIIEFHTRVSDLESPVWPSGTFTSQGQMSQYWEDEKHRDRGYQELRKVHSASTIEAIYKSDKPEVAASLFMSGEPQALFRGNLNPNSIRAVWIKDKVGYSNSPAKRFGVREVLGMIKNGTLPTRHGQLDPKITASLGRKRGVVPFNPRDVVTLDAVVTRYMAAYSHIKDRKELLRILASDPYMMRKVLANDVQYRAVFNELTRLGYNVSNFEKSPIGYDG